MRRPVMIPQPIGPHDPRGAVLGDFLEQIVVGVEEETESMRELIDLQSAGQALVDVVKAVGQGESQLLSGRRAGLANVIAADRNRVPLRHVVRAKLDHVDRQPHRGLGRKVNLVLSVKFLERVVLDRAPQLLPIEALVLGIGQIKGHHDRGRGVDRHRHRELADVDAIEQLPHVVDRVDRHAQPAHFAQRARVVAVQAHQRGQVEGRAQSGLSLADQEFESLVGLPRGAETGELPHRPQPPAIHRGMHAAGVGILARKAQIGFVVPAFEVVGRVERIDRHAADGRGRLRAGLGLFDFSLPSGPLFAIDGGCHGALNPST